MKLQYNLDETVHLDSEDDDPLQTAFIKNCISSIEVLDDENTVVYRWIRDNSLQGTITEEE